MARLVPLISGGPPAPRRDQNVPRMMSVFPAYGMTYFEDFNSVTVGTAVTGGHPNWLVTAIAGSGTTGVTGLSGATGAIGIYTGSSANDGQMVDLGSRTSTVGGTVNGSTQKNFMWRVVLGSTITSSITGFGMVDAAAVSSGTNWITDPDVSLAASNSLVFTRHAASYSGDTAGALVARLYENTGTDDASLELVAAPTGSGSYKVEAQVSPAGSILFWVNETYIGSIACPTVASLATRPSFGCQTTTTAQRSFFVDAYYQEQGRSSAR